MALTSAIHVTLGFMLIISVLGLPDLDSAEEGSAENESELSLKCKACKMIVDKVRKGLPQNADQAAITQQLKKVCASLGPLKSVCKGFVKRYLSKLAAEIASADDAKTACVVLHLHNTHPVF
ncbi:antimicrobial peptide NK-lysin-like [Engraulis encrasicolus]|uniref:antimicrobial peptide NK-lysin-like n=1 Tax=Engraulis encrasicolus TaxID=184585 RepID=UPI002FD47A3F